MLANPGNIRDQGDIKVSVAIEKVEIDVTVSVGDDKKIAVTVDKQEGDISKLDYKLDSHSWVIKMADAAAHGTIVSKIKEAVSEVLSGTSGVLQADINKFLSTFDYAIQIGSTDVLIDTHIVQLKTDGDFDIGLNGTAYEVTRTIQVPYKPVELPSWATEADGRLQFSSYVLNSLAFVGHS